MNKYAMQTILKRLIDIKNKVNIDKEEGICVNLDNIWYPTRTKCSIKQQRSKSTFINEDQLYKWLFVQFQSWPECHVYEDGAKSLGYPVGGWDELDKEITNGTIWQNPKRLRLLDYLIKQATTQLKEMDKEQ